nr:patellin-4 [Quercus suber]
MATITENDGKHVEKNVSKDVENKDVTVANVKVVEENGEPKKKDVHEIDGVVTENTKNVAEEVKEVVKKEENGAEKGDVSPSPNVETSSKKESNFFSHLKVHEKKALVKLRMKIEEVIRGKAGTENTKKDYETLEKTDEAEKKTVSSPPPTIEKSSSFREESNFPSDLKESEKNALSQLRMKVEEAIHGNTLLKGKKEKIESQANATSLGKESKDKEKQEEESDNNVKEEKAENNDAKESKESKQDTEEKKKLTEEAAKESTHVAVEEEKVIVDEDIALWGVPLLPSKADTATDEGKQYRFDLE